MTGHLSVLSWNVENFHPDPERFARIVDFLVAADPDVFALYEVKGKPLFQNMAHKMSGYHVSVTESESIPEILVGVRNNFFSFVTQKDELASKVPTLRPGALATIGVDGRTVSILFLHLKSFKEPRSWGLRDDMFKHVAKLKRRIESELTDEGPANFIAMGDLNTMGMSAPYNDDLDIDGATELGFVDRRMRAKVNGMRRLVKTHEVTWWNGRDSTKPSNLDHVYAANHLAFKAQELGAEVETRGWVNESTVADQKRWIGEMSDHCALIARLAINSAQ